MPSLLCRPLLLPGDLPCGSGLQPSCSADPCCVSLGGFLSVAAVLCLLLPPAKGVVGFCCASWPCLSSWSCSTWVFIHSVSGDWLLLGGFSCWLFLLAGSQGCALLPLALVAFRLRGWTGGGGGGGGGLLPLDLRGSGVGTVSFRPFSDGCLSLHWQAWRDRGPEPWVAVVLRFGYCLPFLGSPPLFNAPLPILSYSPTSI